MTETPGRAHEWFVEEDGQLIGPLRVEELLARLRLARDPWIELVWRQGLRSRLPAGAVPEIVARLKDPLSTGGAPVAQQKVPQPEVAGEPALRPRLHLPSAIEGGHGLTPGGGSERQSLLVRLWHGELGLARSYWGWLIFGMSVGWGILRLSVGDRNVAAPAPLVLALLAYWLLALVAVWNAAGKYAGPPRWARSARLLAGASFVLWSASVVFFAMRLLGLQGAPTAETRQRPSTGGLPVKPELALAKPGTPAGPPGGEGAALQPTSMSGDELVSYGEELRARALSPVLKAFASGDLTGGKDPGQQEREARAYCQYFEDGLRARPSQDVAYRAYMNLGNCFSGEVADDEARAVHNFEQAVQVAGTPAAAAIAKARLSLLRVQSCQLKGEDLDRSLADQYEAVDANPDDLLLRRNLVRSLTHVGRMDAAARVWDRGFPDTPFDRVSLLYKQTCK